MNMSPVYVFYSKIMLEDLSIKSEDWLESTLRMLLNVFAKDMSPNMFYNARRALLHELATR